MPHKRVGLIVNPIAGMGGKVGLKGTDGAETAARARDLGAEPLAGTRARRALERMAALSGGVEIVAPPGTMGEDAARAGGIQLSVIAGLTPRGGDTNADDTRAAAAAMMRQGVDLLIFAGGDGTARDVHSAVGDKQPILGIPAGVKMQSGVFAANPASAGNLAAAFVSDAGTIRLRDAEVVDIDEAALRENRVSARLYGYAKVPYERWLMQNAKSRPAALDDTALDALAARIVSEMENDRLYVLGPGRTTKRILDHLGVNGTLLGVDAVCNRKLAGADLNELQLLKLIESRPATIIVGVIGGQGYLFGRGNQQISAAVIRRVGRENIVVVAGAEKLIALDPPVLRADTGDDEIDRMLSGFARVHVAPGQSIMIRLIA